MLRGEETLLLRKDVTRTSAPLGKPGNKAVIADADRELWEALRAKRKQLADAHGVPPYVIFPDSTLVDMLRQRPDTLQDMGLVSGIGSHKLERYGADFLQVLQQTGAGSELVERDAKAQAHEINALVLSGMSAEQAALQVGKPLRQVYSQLAQAIATGDLTLEQAIDIGPAQLERIQDAFLNHDGEDLPGVRTLARELDEAIDEGVLHCIRAALVAEISG